MKSSATMRALWTTNDVPDRERFAYWRDVSSRAFVPHRPEPIDTRAFRGCLEVLDTGEMHISHVRANAQRVCRGRPEIARSLKEPYFVAVQMMGRSTVRQGTEEAHMEPGDVLILDTAKPYELELRTTFHHLVFEVPREVLASRLPARTSAKLSLRPTDAALGVLAANYVRTVAAVAASGRADVLRSLASNLVDLLAIAWQQPLDDPDQAERSVAQARFFAACDHIDRHFRDPLLTPATIATALGISKRYLHKLFHLQGCSVMQRVVARRIEHCRDELANPALAGKTISDIAFDAGFSDLSHFGRAFKARFGTTPREFRAQVRES